MSDGMLSIFEKQAVLGVEKILGGVVEAYDENDSILDTTLITKFGNLDLWAFYQDDVDRETLRKLFEESRRLKRAKQSQFVIGSGFFCKSESEAKPASYPVVLEPKPISKIESQPQWIKSHDEVLKRLEANDTNSDDYEKALLIAEITDFPAERIERLLNALRKYISDNRFASNDDSIVLLGCAIRKYAMNMSEEHFNEYAKWLQPTATRILDSKVELELVKGLDSRVSYSHVSLDGHEIDEAISIVGEVCEEYSSRRRLLKENHASIAVEANHAIVLLNLLAGGDKQAKEELDRAKKLDPDWVAELIVEQLEETTEIMKDRESGTSEKILVLLKS